MMKEWLAGRPSGAEAGDVSVQIEKSRFKTSFGVQVFTIRIRGKAHGVDYDDILLVRGEERADAIGRLIVNSLSSEEAARQSYRLIHELHDQFSHGEVNGVPAWKALLGEVHVKRDATAAADNDAAYDHWLENLNYGEGEKACCVECDVTHSDWSGPTDEESWICGKCGCDTQDSDMEVSFGDK